MAKLLNSPLQEVIFEVRWTLQPSDEGQMVDPGFELASGRLSTILEKQMPVYKRVLNSNLFEQFLVYNVVHQYWKGEKQWPVVQLGPGIFTINCTDEWYDWETNFFPFIQDAIQWLIKAYKTPLQFAFASLRYIDGISVRDYGGIKDGWQDFINTHFNFSYNNNFDAGGIEKNFVFNQVFELEDKSSLQIQMSQGQKRNDVALIWQTAVLKKQNFTTDDLIGWIHKAHEKLHNLFEQMLKPETYASFGRKNEN